MTIIVYRLKTVKRVQCRVSQIENNRDLSYNKQHLLETLGLVTHGLPSFTYILILLTFKKWTTSKSSPHAQ